jgi:chaperonin GroES
LDDASAVGHPAWLTCDQRETVRIGVILRQIITSAVSRFSLNPFAAGSVLFGEPGGPEPEGNDMAFRPLHDRVVVKRLEGEEKTKGGIIIPDTAKEKPQEGKIIAVGPGGRDETGKLTPLDVKAGDRVLFGKWSGTEVKIGEEELLIMKESDILGIVD